MNLCITNVCNRRCEYCFQKNWFLANSKEEIQEMSLDTVNDILNWFQGEHFKLLGGEPLLYSKIIELLDMIKDKEKTITMISNISINPEKFKNIINNYCVNTPITSWLINTDYPKHQEDIFISNFKELLKTKNDITLSTTLLPNKEKISESYNRLKKLCEYGNRRIFGIRISPSEPNYKDAFSNYNFTLEVYDMFLKLKRRYPYIKMNFDCPVNACEIDYKVFEEKRINLSFSKERCGDGNIPFDILPDKTGLWCFSSNFLKVDNVLDYIDEEDCIKELQRQYNNYWINNKLMCNYEKCGKYGNCKGLCPAKNESLKIHKLNSKGSE